VSTVREDSASAPPAPWGAGTLQSSRIVPALCALFTSAVCTLVWHDAQDAALDALADGFEAVVPPYGAETRLRIVIVARDPLSSRHGALHAWAERNEVASLEVPPLDAAACRQLIATLEHRRGRSLQEEAILASGGNPLALQLAVAVGPAAACDPMVGLGRAIDALPSSARALLFVLLAAETSLRDVDLRGVRLEHVQRLAPALTPCARRPRRRSRVAGAADDGAGAVAGGPAPAGHLGGARGPRAPRPRRSARRSGGAAARLPRPGAARAAASPAALERTLGEIARGDAAAAADALLALAREQLRWGDFEAARRTLDGLAALELSPPLAYRRCILRRGAVRAGEPASATQELERARLVTPPGAEIALEEGLADLAALRGDLYGARRALLRLARSTRSIPSLEGRRAVSLGFSYLLEERHDRALARARKACQAYRPRGEAAVDIVVPIVEIAALMGLDQIDRATEVAARETAVRTSRDDRGLGQGTAILFQAGVLFRRGQLEQAMLVGEPAFRALDRRADRIFRARVAPYLARSAIGLGQFERAEEFIRIAAGIAAEPGLGVLRPMCEIDFALLCEARGARREAADRSGRAPSGA
jgi:hypothetical protein